MPNAPDESSSRFDAPLVRRISLGCAAIFVVAAALAFFANETKSIAAEVRSAPNILFLVSDDQGWNDVGYHNPQMRTPHLDRLAKTGIELDCHYVQPQCSPTRVALLTGRYPSRFGLHCCRATNEPTFPLGTVTLASMLKQQGYETGMSGKWHVGPNADLGPNRFGFDYSHGSFSGAVGMYDHRYKLESPLVETWHRNGELIPGRENGTHVTDLTAGEAIRWIEAREKSEKPWFFYAPFHAPHNPLVENDKRWDEMNRHIDDDGRRLYAAAVSHLDDAIGRILDALDRTDQRQRTIVVFTSDNGAQVDHVPPGYPPPDPQLKNFSSNKPLRGRKSTAYEGGIRVPAIVHWPGKLTARKISEPLHAIDWAPTLAALAGYQPSDELRWEGRDLWPLLSGEAKSLGERNIYTVWGFKREWESLRRGDWKIVRRKGKPWELYQLADDPNEASDLAEQEVERRDALIRQYREERRKDAGGGK